MFSWIHGASALDRVTQILLDVLVNNVGENE